MNTSNSLKVNAANSRMEKDSSGCCGGPAPVGNSACCAKDAGMKSTGGCGCGSVSHPNAQTKGSCCA